MPPARHRGAQNGSEREHQVRTDKKGVVQLDLPLAFTQGQVGRLVSESETNGSQLHLIRSVLPLVGCIVGIPVLLLGLFLTIRRRRRGARVAE